MEQTARIAHMETLLDEVTAAISGLSPENQAAIGKYIANLINTAMDLAEQIAPMLNQQPTDPAA